MNAAATIFAALASGCGDGSSAGQPCPTCGGSSSSGGETSGLGGSSGGHPSGSGAVPGTGAVTNTGGISGSGSASGGNAEAGGASQSGGESGGGQNSGGQNSGGQSSGGQNSGGSSGSCDSGTRETDWASECPTTPPGCTPGTWTADGPDPDHQSFATCAESEHFVLYSDEACTASASSALDHLESVWDLFFGSPMYMREPLCDSAQKYKAAIHVHSDWGLSGGAWDGLHMGMWIGTGGLGDHWGLAHEFMHGVQSVQGGQRCNASNTCGWVYESHANWAAHQQEEYHQTDLHCSEMLANMPHLYLGSTRDRYCNWQFMEYLKDKHCFGAVNAIWTGEPSADPFTAIRNGLGWSLSQLNDFMGEWATHNVTWDYQDPEPQATAGQNQGALYRSVYGNLLDRSQTIRRLRTTKLLPMDESDLGAQRFYSPPYWAPQRYGYNVVRLIPEAGVTEISVTFRGVTEGSATADWRWGLVATDSQLTESRYSELQAGADGALSFCLGDAEELFLVVSATPSGWYDIVWDQPYNTVPRYPYMLELSGAWPEGFSDGAKEPCPDGLEPASDGGGCAPPGTAGYVGPYATVLSGSTVASGARIEDHAVVANGAVTGGTVGALTLVGFTGGFGGNEFSVSSGSARTTFYPLGFFEPGQSLAGASLIGDVELRGTNQNMTAGTCSGFVDASTCMDPGTDQTPLPPYSWR